MPLVLPPGSHPLCKQRLSPEHFHPSGTGVSMQKGMWFCYRPGWTPHHTERTEQNSPILLSDLGQSMLHPCPQFPNRILCICESTIPPYHLTIWKTHGKIPRSLQGHHTSGDTLIHIMPTWQHVGSPPCFPCIHAWACSWEHNSTMYPVASAPSCNWQWTRVRGLQNLGLKNQQMSETL